ncbi:2168_t:CDS:2 [Paraglomus brasilianum]|uniref:2168_t:CDS:1 n=1 Tax=Paraglomus brasilianum TaxID=144538 RepID=A0A9N9EZ42_9GLOM|nr:2168_t:CDS:2 [Paraglomus brasilianum]
MRVSFVVIAALILGIQQTVAYTIVVKAGVKECFYEDLHKDDRMTITFQVGEGGHLDIDFTMTDPNDRPIIGEERQSTGTFSVGAQDDGRYTYCFSNEMSSVTDKSVSFNVHGIVYIPEDSSHTDPVEKEIRELADNLAAIKDEQAYLVIRERTHRNTAESTNDRVKWWSLFQFGVLIAVCLWQVYYLKSFFEVKRVV